MEQGKVSRALVSQRVKGAFTKHPYLVSLGDVASAADRLDRSLPTFPKDSMDDLDDLLGEVGPVDDALMSELGLDSFSSQ